MRDLLPDGVVVEVAGLTDWTGELLPAEAACLGSQAVASRRRDFTAGRVCARRALAGLGQAVVPVPAEAGRAPVWPAGVVGSITHTAGYCAAAVASMDRFRAVGIDAEQHRSLEEGVRRMICRPAELAWCANRSDGVHWETVVFSAKETVYKIWYPVVAGWLDFQEAELEISPADGRFVARIDPGPVAAARARGLTPPTTVSGRFVVRDGLVRTAAVLPLG